MNPGGERDRIPAPVNAEVTVAKSKKERRSSIRHMAADDAFSVLEALEAAEQREGTTRSDETSADGEDTDEEADGTPSRA